MKSIRNTKIKTKLLMLGAVSILGLVLMGVESVTTAKEINQASTDISESWLPSIIITEELNTSASSYRMNEYYHVITHDEEIMSHLEIDMMKLRESISKDFDQYEPYVADDTDRLLIDTARESWERYLECGERLLAVSNENRTQDAMNMIIGESRVLFDEAILKLRAVADYNQSGAELASVKGDNLYVSLVKEKVVTILAISILIGILVVYIISAIDKPVEAIVEGTRRVANGDLDVFLDYRSDDEIGVLTESVNQLASRLKNMIEDETHMFQEIGNENYQVKSTCQQSYRGDFAPVLYSIESLKSRLETMKEKEKEEENQVAEAETPEYPCAVNVQRIDTRLESMKLENLRQESRKMENLRQEPSELGGPDWEDGADLDWDEEEDEDGLE